MDLLKIPLEKVFYLVAGIIPGLVALLIYEVASPGSFTWFFKLESLGYNTKLVLVLSVCFLIGNSMTAFSGAFLRFVGGAVGRMLSLRPYKPAHSFPTSPWRDRAWRTVMKKTLGSDAPGDTLLLTEDNFSKRVELLQQLPEELRVAELAKLKREKLQSELNDTDWRRWYDTYHQIVLQADPEAASRIGSGLSFNLETAAFYTLISVWVVPQLRQWWCVLPASLWAVLGILEQVASVRQYLDHWSSLSAQIKLLSGSAVGDRGQGKTPEL